MKDTAYRSVDDEVLEAWEKYAKDRTEVQERRLSLRKEIGRGLMARRLGFGHGTRIVGFERAESDKDKDLLAEGSLIVSSRSGHHHGMVVPNIRRKSGKAFEARLRELDSPDMKIPGMPPWHLSSSAGGLSSMAPGMMLHDGALWAFWGCDDAPVGEQWEKVPLSVYHAALEAYEAAGL